MHIKTKTNKKHNKKMFSQAADFMPMDPQAQFILHQRADLLAKDARKTQNKNDTLIEYIQFSIGTNSRYGIPYAAAEEIIVYPKIATLPFVSNYIAGIVNHRGLLLTIIDLAVLLHDEQHVSTEQNEIIIVRQHSVTLGLRIDGISGSDAYDEKELDSGIFSANIPREFILGLHKGITAILNVDAIITHIINQLARTRS